MWPEVNAKFPRLRRACVNVPRGSFPRGTRGDESSTYRGKNLGIYEKTQRETLDVYVRVCAALHVLV